MNISQPEQRLASLWGLIDGKHNELVRQRVVGSSVLDLGCGYGSLTAFLTSAGLHCEGWDNDPAAVAVAQKLFPQANVKQFDLLRYEEVEQKFDTIVLKDSFHHVATEGDPDLAFRAIRHLLADDGRLVIWDPNPTPFVRLARVLIGHRDAVAPLRFARELLARHAFEIRQLDYYEAIGLPLSGGYVGPRLAPNVKVVNHSIVRVNDWCSRVANKVGLGRVLCWRYLISADKGSLSAAHES